MVSGTRYSFHRPRFVKSLLRLGSTHHPGCHLEISWRVQGSFTISVVPKPVMMCGLKAESGRTKWERQKIPYQVHGANDDGIQKAPSPRLESLRNGRGWLSMALDTVNRFSSLMRMGYS